jgi:hypothetical protein
LDSAVYQVASSKLTWRPCQSSGSKDKCPLKISDFQGQTVDLPEGKSHY